MKIGKLYQVKEYFWFLYPSKDIATAAAAVIAAAYWSKQYNCEVTYFSPDSYIVFLEEDTKFKKVLTSTGKLGWVWFDESYNHCFEEVSA
jgi:hypothetical protein